MNEILKKIGDAGIVPTVKIDNAKSAIPLAKAVLAGGLSVIEITFRTPAAEEAVRQINREVPEMLLGAGTILTIEQVKKAIDAGAKFLVSPGFNPEVVKYCVENNIPIIPGCSNPTDIEMAMGYGLEVIKFFPAEAFGGVAAIKALSGPYPGMQYIPTGGIDESNLADYILFPKTLAVGGSWMVKPELIDEGKFEEIAQLTKNALYKMFGFEVAHIGINNPNESEALKIANTFSKLFGFPVKDGNSSAFAGTGLEIVKSMGLGSKGHIAIKTNCITKAVAYFENLGAALDMSSIKTKNNKMTAVYFKDEIAGFAIHLMQK